MRNMAFLSRVPVEDKFPHLRRLYGPFSQGFDRATTLSIYDGTYDVRVTVDEMINSIVYLFDCHTHFGNLNTSYSFADFELTYFISITDFKKYVPHFKYVNRNGNSSVRFKTEDIQALLANPEWLGELLLVANSEKYISKRMNKLKKNIHWFDHHNGFILAFASSENIWWMKYMGKTEYDSKDDGFTRICEDVVTTNDRVVGYVYSADELANG